jgi:hypothetical protein
MTCLPEQHGVNFLRMKTSGEFHMRTPDPRDYLPDVRDGLTHRERIVRQCLNALQQERGGRECLQACSMGLSSSILI